MDAAPADKPSLHGVDERWQHGCQLVCQDTREDFELDWYERDRAVVARLGPIAALKEKDDGGLPVATKQLTPVSLGVEHETEEASKELGIELEEFCG